MVEVVQRRPVVVALREAAQVRALAPVQVLVAAAQVRRVTALQNASTALVRVAAVVQPVVVVMRRQSVSTALVLVALGQLVAAIVRAATTNVHLVPNLIAVRRVHRVTLGIRVMRVMRVGTNLDQHPVAPVRIVQVLTAQVLVVAVVLEVTPVAVVRVARVRVGPVLAAPVQVARTPDVTGTAVTPLVARPHVRPVAQAQRPSHVLRPSRSNVLQLLQVKVPNGSACRRKLRSPNPTCRDVSADASRITTDVSSAHK